MQNVVMVLCPLVHRYTTVKDLQVLLFTWVNFDLALTAGQPRKIVRLTVRVKSEITERVNLLVCHESTRQRNY